jgi:hypothetical protein
VNRALLIAAVASLLAAVGIAAPPLAGSWNITPSGSAASSGDLLFRVTPAGGDPVEITVPVRSGSDDVTVARSIRQALSSQLRRDRYTVQLGEGANVLVSDPRGKPSFSVELINSDIDNMRIAVRNIEPGATPTVPAQAAPANSPTPATPPQPGAATPPTQNPTDAVPPATNPQPPPTPPGGASSPMAPPPNNAPPPPGSTPPASAPPGSSPPGNTPPGNTPPPTDSPAARPPAGGPPPT